MARHSLPGLWRPWEGASCYCHFCRQGELNKIHQDQTFPPKKIRKCEICSEEFTRKDNLTRHKKCKHGGVGKPRCRYCQKPLSRKDSASRHEKTCQGNRDRQQQSRDDDGLHLHNNLPSTFQRPHRPNVIVRLEKRREGSVASDSFDDSSRSSSSSN